jgi:hypothetical protein
VVIADHKLYFTCEAGLDIALQFDDLDKIDRPFIIPDIVLPGLLIFLDELAVLLHVAIQSE